MLWVGFSELKLWWLVNWKLRFVGCKGKFLDRGDWFVCRCEGFGDRIIKVS